MQKSLPRRLEAIVGGTANFILADAKDADMAFGIRAPGTGWDGRPRSLAEYRQKIRDVVQQGLVDIVIMSASTNEALALDERIFDGTAVTPAARANDTTDIWLSRGGTYAEAASLPFRTASIEHIQCGRQTCSPEERGTGTNLGLYSMTFNNDVARDCATLEAFKQFRLEAEAKGFRYFLEVFAPNVKGAVPSEDVGAFLNDHIVRALAGVTRAALAELPEDQRLAFVLQTIEGLTADEAASVMQCPVNTARSRKILAIKKLRARLQTVWDTESIFLRSTRS